MCKELRALNHQVFYYFLRVQPHQRCTIAGRDAGLLMPTLEKGTTKQHKDSLGRVSQWMYSYHGLVCCYGDIVHFVDVVVQVLLGVGQYKLAQVLPGLFGREGRGRAFNAFRRPIKFMENINIYMYNK